MATSGPSRSHRISNEVHIFGNCGRQGNLDSTRLNFSNDSVKYIKSGNGFMVLLYASGKLILIGDNEKGQLGCNDRSPHDGPQILTIPRDEIPKYIGCGDRHVFLTTLTQRCYVWGRNDMCQLGIFNETNVTAPRFLTSLTHIIQMSGGCHHTLCLVENGRVFVLGINNYGQLGIGKKCVANVTIPISKISNAVQVACGSYHSAVILANGELLTFGQNTCGQLGVHNKYSKEQFSVTPVHVELPSAAVKVSCGSMHTIVLTASGAIYGFGYNGFGQLGLGNFESYFWTPQLIISMSEMKIVDFQCGFNHTVFITDCGNMYACGWGQEGQLGLESTVNRSVPTLVNHPSLEGRFIIGASCGFSHTATISISSERFEESKKEIVINKEALSLQKYLIEKGSSTEEIQELLLCPVCYEVLKCPISQCYEGHVVCSSCKGQLSTCPICRGPFSQVPNRILAEIISSLKNSKKENDTNSETDNEINNDTNNETNNETNNDTNNEINIETNNEINIQTNNETNNDTNNETNNETNNDTNNEINIETNIETNNEINNEINIQTNNETNNEINIETNNDTNNETNNEINIETNNETNNDTNFLIVNACFDNCC